MPNDQTPATVEDKPTSEVIREGANLPADQWNEARLAAARKLLPAGFRSPANMIAFLARAERSGLDPFAGELHAWDDERGELTFQTSRDGFIKILRRDPEIEGVEVGAVFAEDDFAFKRDGNGNITVSHEGSIERGDLKGAYCCVHRSEGPDHIEIRLLADFKHLMGKKNWKNYPIDMLEARCVSACARIATTAAAGIYTEADFELVEGGRRTGRLVGDETERSTDELARRLEAEKDGDEGGEVSEAIEANATEEEVENHDPSGDGQSDMVKGTPDEPKKQPPKEEEPEAEAQGLEDRTLRCDICNERGFDSPQALSGHKSGHSKRGESLPDGFTLQFGEKKVTLVDPEGGRVGKYDDWREAVSAAQAAEAGEAAVEEEGEAEEGEGDAELANDVLEAVQEKHGGKTPGQLMVAAYTMLEDLDDTEAHDLLTEKAALVAGDDPEDVVLHDLNPTQLLELIARLRMHLDESE